MATMTADVPKTNPRKKSLALETFLSSLEANGDLFSGSECSSLATSPAIEKDSYAYSLRRGTEVDDELESERGRGRHREEDQVIRLEPTQLVEKLLNNIDGGNVVDDLLAETAEVQMYSHVISKHEKVCRCCA